MPAIVLIWNLETFGDGFALDPVGAGIAQNLIVALISDLEAEVVLIQELKTNGVTWLPTIVAGLNGIVGAAAPQWRFDWVAGGIAGGAAAGAIAWANMTFNVTNTEGYAVLWRGPLLQAFAAQRSGGVNSINRYVRAGQAFIDTCLEGNRVNVINGFVEPKITRAAPVVAAALTGYPATCGTAAARYREHGVNDWRRDPNVQLLHGSRRPVQVTVQTGGTNYDVMAYHVPNANHATMYGPIIAMNATTRHPAARTIAGDWNTVGTLARRVVGATSTAAPYLLSSPMLQANGACPMGATMVHSCSTAAQPWRQAAGIFTRHRDFAVLTAGLPAAYAVTIPDLVPLFYNALNRPGGALAGTETVTQLQNSAAAIAAQLQNTPAVPRQWPLTTRAGLTNQTIIQEFFACFQNYDGTAATDGVSINTGGAADFNTAFALLYNRYVSDHLPLKLVLP
jgi:hypothetical protein